VVEFIGEDGSKLPGLVRELDNESALIDFNHPLAGKCSPFRSGNHPHPLTGDMDVLLANPRGFCAGVERAIAIVERALEQYGAPIYVRHEVVHNKFVVDSLRAKGAIFIDELDEVPDGATLIFSAHGVPQAVRHDADRPAACACSTPPARW
jgi:hypothetical protein